MLLDSRSPRPVLGLDLRHRRGAAIVGAAVGIALVYLATRVAFAARFPYFIDEGTYASFTYSATQSLERHLGVAHDRARAAPDLGSAFRWVELGFNPLTSMRIGVGAVRAAHAAGHLPAGPAASRTTGWGSSRPALYAILPFFVVHNGIGIMESLVVLVVAAALLIQIDLARRPELEARRCCSGSSWRSGVLTKENTKPAIALIPLSLLCFDWRPRGPARERLTRWLQSIGDRRRDGVPRRPADAVVVLLRRSSSSWRENGFYTTRKLGDVIDHPFASWGTACGRVRPGVRRVRDDPG